MEGGDRKDKKLMVSLNYILSLRPFWVTQKGRKEGSQQTRVTLRHWLMTKPGGKRTNSSKMSFTCVSWHKVNGKKLETNKT